MMTVLFVLIYWSLPVIVLLPWCWWLLRNSRLRMEASAAKSKAKWDAYMQRQAEMDRESDRKLQELRDELVQFRKDVEEYEEATEPFDSDDETPATPKPAAVLAPST